MILIILKVRLHKIHLFIFLLVFVIEYILIKYITISESTINYIIRLLNIKTNMFLLHILLNYNLLLPIAIYTYNINKWG